MTCRMIEVLPDAGTPPTEITVMQLFRKRTDPLKIRPPPKLRGVYFNFPRLKIFGTMIPRENTGYAFGMVS